MRRSRFTVRVEGKVGVGAVVGDGSARYAIGMISVRVRVGADLPATSLLHSCDKTLPLAQVS